MSATDHTEEEGESFFVSMTDIMVGLLFIFLMIIMYFALQAKLDRERIEEYQKTNAPEFTSLTRYQQDVGIQRAKILGWISEYLGKEGVKGVQVLSDQGVIRLPEGVLFRSGEFTFERGGSAEKAVKSIAKALREVLPCSVLSNTGRPYLDLKACQNSRYHNKLFGYVESVFVEGHTDAIKIQGGLRGDPMLTTNLRLSARRSTNTYEAITQTEPSVLQFFGPNARALNIQYEPVLASAAYGESRPADTNETEAGRQANRRIDLRVSMFVPNNPATHQEFFKKLMGGASQ